MDFRATKTGGGDGAGVATAGEERPGSDFVAVAEYVFEVAAKVVEFWLTGGEGADGRTAAATVAGNDFFAVNTGVEEGEGEEADTGSGVVGNTGTGVGLIPGGGPAALTSTGEGVLGSFTWRRGTWGRPTTGLLANDPTPVGDGVGGCGVVGREIRGSESGFCCCGR